MKFPKPLNPGDTIGLVAPSSASSPERVEETIKKLEELGYRVKAADNLAESYHGLMAGPAQKRADWVNRMFADPEVDAIICIRGGDGSSRIMEYLDYDLIRANPKIFCGFSDITNLLLAIPQNCGFVTFHGPMADTNIRSRFDAETARAFYEAVNAEADYEFRNPPGCPLEALPGGPHQGRAAGLLTGGNLSLLCAAVGTPFEMQAEGRIIFIEEVGERVSMIEKYMYHLKNAGVFRKCSGILLGQFTDMTTNCDADFDWAACVQDILADVEKPILWNVQSGHGEPMLTLPMGAECEMNATAGTIRIRVER